MKWEFRSWTYNREVALRLSFVIYDPNIESQYPDKSPVRIKFCPQHKNPSIEQNSLLFRPEWLRFAEFQLFRNGTPDWEVPFPKCKIENSGFDYAAKDSVTVVGVARKVFIDSIISARLNFYALFFNRPPKSFWDERALCHSSDTRN